MISSIPYIGETFSLLSAILWALAVIFFRKSGEQVHPLALNMFKDLLALVLFVPTIFLFGVSIVRPVPLSAYTLLLLSGVIGIGVGDTVFFMSLNILGAGLTGIVICMYSPFIIMLSTIFLGERMSLPQIVGAFLIISAVLIATIERQKITIGRHRLVAGVLLGVLSSAAMAAGIVMIKPLLEGSPVLWATGIRLFGGTVVLTLILLFYRGRHRIIDSLISTKRLSYAISGSFIGAYLAMIVWIAGMKYTQASVASALNQTSVIFIFIFAGLILSEPLNLRRATGIILAFVGSFLVSFL